MSTTAAEMTTLPELSSDYSVSPSQTAEYRQQGHTVLRAVASPEEIGMYRPAIVDAADRYNPETRPLDQRDTYGKAFLQIMNLWERDDTVRRFTLAHRFAQIAADLMGVPAVRVYHDQALFKEPDGGPTPWHQDQFYWPLNTDDTITMWMPLVDIPAEVGSMTFGSGSHKFGYLGDLPISDKSQAELEKFISERGIEKHCHGGMKAGDATFHNGWTLHCAPNNPTRNMREVMTIIYFKDGARVTEATNKGQAADLGRWLPDLKPGDLAAGRLNPLV